MFFGILEGEPALCGTTTIAGPNRGELSFGCRWGKSYLKPRILWTPREN